MSPTIQVSNILKGVSVRERKKIEVVGSQFKF